MSDVLIKGMEMPKFYEDCPFNYKGLCAMCDNEVCLLNVARGEPQHDACPIVPVQPHGRLIDADEYQAKMRNAYDDDWFTVLEDTPTVIPANGENACFPVEEKG
jgi:hypothetical protein